MGIIPGQVQVEAAKSAGVSDNRLVVFKDQDAAITALLAGEIDVFAGTAVGNRAVADEHKTLEAVAHEIRAGQKVPVGAFSFSKNNRQLLQAVNEQLRKYLGSADHRSRVAKYGITENEIDSVLPSEGAAR